MVVFFGLIVKYSNLILLFISVIILPVWSIPALQQPTEDRRESLHSLAFSVCLNIANRTELKLFYATDLNSDPSFQHLIQDLHENSIQTISISHPNKMTESIVTDQRINMIFNFQDVGELFNFIFHTISQSEHPRLNHEAEKDPGHSANGRKNLMDGTLPRYCIKIDEIYHLWTQEGCSKEINIPYPELADCSSLSDSVFNATRGFYRNKIWNFGNHLIFLVKNVGQNIREFTPKALSNTNFSNFETNKDLTLLFCFKFFWRFFKSQKSVICHPDGCVRYDPFAENLIFYQDWSEIDEDFFDFPRTNMHRKPIQYLVDFSRRKGMRTLNDASWSDWYTFFLTVLEHLKNTLNFTLKYDSNFVADNFEVEDALRHDVDLLLYETGIILDGSDYPNLDFSVSVETSALCIATPHTGYMSQGLVIFKSFSPIVWIFISITIATLIVIQYYFQYLQCTLFHRLYTEAEVDYYRETSSLLTVYAYFICGSPPSLRLGRLFTGKGLFLIFSFSTIIISTVFLSGMTTLLSDRVLYPEVDSLKSLEESNMIIQTFEDPKAEMNFFHHLNLSEALREKLVGSLHFYTSQVGGEVFTFTEKYYDEGFINETDPTNYFLLLYKYIGNAIEEVKKNLLSVSETDAVLVSVPFSSKPKENILMKEFLLKQWYEYHVIAECLLTYPLIFAFAKHSFLFEKLNQIMAQYSETGLARRILETVLTNDMKLGVPYAENSPEPRAFDFNNLQSAFIGLSVGLFISFLAFVGELLFDYFRHSAIVKFLIRFQDSLCKRGRN